MKPTLGLSTSGTLVVVVALAGAVSWWGASLAVAQPAPATVSASATAAAAGATSSAGAAGSGEPAKAGVPIATYAWPTAASPEPTDAEWAGATELDVPYRNSPTAWRPASDTPPCSERAVREWVRITCPPAQPGVESDGRYGVVWGLGGDLSGVKGKLFPASKTELHKAPVTNDDRNETVARQTGAFATLTFQVKPGSAFVVSMDKITSGWEYDGGFSVSSTPAHFIDVSWAKGEKAPTIAVR